MNINSHNEHPRYSGMGLGSGNSYNNAAGPSALNKAHNSYLKLLSDVTPGSFKGGMSGVRNNLSEDRARFKPNAF
jgi:hypothetical protein